MKSRYSRKQPMPCENSQATSWTGKRQNQEAQRLSNHLKGRTLVIDVLAAVQPESAT
jgi:hypothetical protein